MIKHYHREEEGFHCFLSLSRSEALAGETSHNAEEVIKSTRLDGTLNKHRNELLEEIKFRISDETESIVDDFLEKDIVSVYEHEEISADTNKSNAAHLLLNCIKNKLPHSYLAMLSVLKTYGAHDLAGRLEAIDDNDFEQTEREFTATWKMLDGELHLTSKVPFEELGVLEVKFTKIEGGIERAVILAIKDAEVTVAQRTHSTYYKTSTGSIIIVFQTESCYAMAKLRQFIETEGISKFLSQIFESSYVRKLLTKEKYEIDVQIREVKERKDPNLDSLQSTEHKKLENTYKSRLDRCHIFLVEELQPRCLLKEKEVADIFSSVLEKMREPSLRRAKVEFFLEHLKKQPEEKIKLVLDKLQDKNEYIYEQLFPDTAKYRDTDIEQIKGNILDSLPNLLDVVNIRAIQTPLLSEGIISPEELDLIHMSSGSLRNKTLQFVKLVLHRGTEAIKIFLSALEISCGESIVENLLQQRANIQMTSATEERHAKIKYEAFNEEDGLLFKGRFLLELKTEAEIENKDVEVIYAREEGPPKEENPDSEFPPEENSSSESDSSDAAHETKSDNDSKFMSAKGSNVETLELDSSEILSKLTRKLGNVEDVLVVKRILSSTNINEERKRNEIQRRFPKKFEKIKEDVSKLQHVLEQLQSLRSVFTEKYEYHCAGEIEELEERDQDETKQISCSGSTARLERQDTLDTLMEEYGDTTLTESDEDKESSKDLNQQSSKYQGILMGKLRKIEVVQSVMKVFKIVTEKETQLMAIKDILNEEQYKKLEKYIIKLQNISEKIGKTAGSADVA